MRRCSRVMPSRRWINGTTIGITYLLAMVSMCAILWPSRWIGYDISPSLPHSNHEERIGGSRNPWCCLIDFADRQFEIMCGRPPHEPKLMSSDSTLVPNQTWKPIFSALLPLQEDPFSDSVIVGHEAWHYSTLRDLLISAPGRCGFYDEVTPFVIKPEAIDNEYPLRPISDESYRKPRRPLPFIYNAYTERLPEGRKRAEDRLNYLQVNISNEHEVKWITFGEGERALERREWLEKHVWKKASSTTDFTKNQLSSFNVFEVFDHIAQESEEEAKIRRLERRKLFAKAGVSFTDADAVEDDEVVIFLEDDAFPVYRFRDKYEIFYDQLSRVHPDWDIAWLGTCLGLHRHRSGTEADKHASLVSSTRCFNAVIFKRRVAIDVMKRGSVTEEYLPIDHLFNKLIHEIPLKTAWSLPPLFYEASKAQYQIPC